MTSESSCPPAWLVDSVILLVVVLVDPIASRAFMNDYDEDVVDDDDDGNARLYACVHAYNK
eukprot:1457096-Karenia_brevis.AAC.1